MLRILVARVLCGVGGAGVPVPRPLHLCTGTELEPSAFSLSPPPLHFADLNFVTPSKFDSTYSNLLK